MNFSHRSDFRLRVVGVPETASRAPAVSRSSAGPCQRPGEPGGAPVVRGGGEAVAGGAGGDDLVADRGGDLGGPGVEGAGVEVEEAGVGEVVADADRGVRAARRSASSQAWRPASGATASSTRSTGLPVQSGGGGRRGRDLPTPSFQATPGSDPDDQPVRGGSLPQRPAPGASPAPSRGPAVRSRTRSTMLGRPTTRSWMPSSLMRRPRSPSGDPASR